MSGSAGETEWIGLNFGSGWWSVIESGRVFSNQFTMSLFGLFKVL
jgi:hypothetical protein